MRLIFLIFLLVCHTVCFAGKAADSVFCTFVQGTLPVTARNPVAGNILSFKYTGSDTIQLHIVPADASVRLFNAGNITLPPGAQQNQLLKFMFPGNCLFNNYNAGVWCITTSGDSLYAGFKLSVTAQRDVQLYTTEPAPLISNAAAALLLPVVVRNKGNTKEQLTLHAGNALPDMNFSMDAFTDTTITVNVPGNNKTVLQPFSLILLDSAGQTIAVTDVRPRLVSNRLQLQPAGTMPADNFASVQFSNNSNGNSYLEYQLSYNRNATANGLILAAYAFDGTGLSQPNIANSFIGYRKDMFAAKLGLLNIWGELPVYGQGGNITLGDNRRYITASYLHNGNPYLNNETHSTDNETKNIHAAWGYDVSDKLYANGMFLHQWQNVFNKDIYTGGLSLQWQAGKNNVVETALYGNTGETAIGHEQGGAAHVRWNVKGKRLQLFSDNYYSSPDYAGLLKNTAQFSETITWHTAAKDNAFGLSLVGNYMNSNPFFYDDHLQRIDNLLVNEQYGVAVAKRSGPLTWRVQPYYGRQQIQLGAGDLYTLNNWYNRLDLQYDHHAFTASANIVTALQTGQQGIKSNALPLRMQCFLQYKYVTLQALYQHRPVFASDLQQEAATGKIFSLAGVGPGLNFKLLHEHLNLYGNYNLQYFNGTAMQYVFAGATANVLANWQLSAGYTCTIGSFNTYTDLRVGVRFLFRRPADMFSRRRTMVFYNDENHNGKKDNAERTIPGVLIGMEPTLARSGADGSIKLLRYRHGREQLSLVDGNGYVLPGEISAYDLKQKKTYIPMYSMGTVSGKITLLLPKYSKRSVTITGLPLVFTDEAGKTFTCYVQAGGGFSISLPVGNYTIKTTPELSDMYQLQQAEVVQVGGQGIRTISLDIRYGNAQPVEMIRFSGRR